MHYRTRRKVDVALLALGGLVLAIAAGVAAAVGDGERIGGYWVLARVEDGRAIRKPYTADRFSAVTLGISCVQRPGEAINSARILARVGPRIAVALHYGYEQIKQGQAG